MPHEDLVKLIGREEATVLQRRAEGRGGTSLARRDQPKSVSRETTFRRDVSDPRELDRVLLLLTARVAAQLRVEALVAGAVVLKLRHGDFTTLTRRTTLKPPASLDTAILEAARRLLAPAFAQARQQGQAIRLLGVAATNLNPSGPADLFATEGQLRQETVTRAVDTVRARFGFDALQSGRLVRPPRPGEPDPEAGD
jgi:DNA polymerase-4